MDGRMLMEDHADIAVELLRRMKRTRWVEETIAERYPQGEMRCPTHLSTGQEAVGVAAGMALRREDQAVSTHRSHAHYLGKGGDLKRMIAELYGKETGCSRGRGGSMHLVDVSVGFLASTAIVGNSIAVGVGAALSNKLLGNGLVSCVFMGDAIAETGVFHESINFAVLKSLPVLFICENNLYSVYTHLRDRQPEERRIWELAAAHGARAESGDGNDAWGAYVQICTALSHIRAGNGPVFLEFSTYRWREHCGPYYDDDLGYRPEGELEQWKARDPVAKLEGQLVEMNMLSSGDVKAMEAEIRTETDEAFCFAEDSPFPSPEQAFTRLFSEQE